MAPGRYLPLERESDMSPLFRLVCLLLLIAAEPALAQSQSMLDCTGPFACKADESAVAKVLGPIAACAAIDIGEAMTERRALVFPADNALAMRSTR